MSDAHACHFKHFHEEMKRILLKKDLILQIDDPIYLMTL